MVSFISALLRRGLLRCVVVLLFDLVHGLGVVLLPVIRPVVSPGLLLVVPFSPVVVPSLPSGFVVPFVVFLPFSLDIVPFGALSLVSFVLGFVGCIRWHYAKFPYAAIFYCQIKVREKVFNMVPFSVCFCHFLGPVFDL